MPVGTGPAGQFLGNRIHEDDFARGIGSDDAVSDTAQCGGEPGFAGAHAPFHLVTVEGNLNYAAEVAVGGRFENVAEGLGELGAIDGVLIGMRGQVDDRDLEFGFQRLRRGDAIHVAFQADVHEDEIERRRPGATEGFHSGLGNGRNGVTEAFELLLDVGGNQAFVFYDQDVFGSIFV